MKNSSESFAFDWLWYANNPEYYVEINLSESSNYQKLFFLSIEKKETFSLQSFHQASEARQ